MTNSLQMIVLEKIKTDQNILEHFFTFYDINDRLIIKEIFRISLSQIRKFNPNGNVILELSRDEKKLYFNSTILKIEGKI